MIQMSLSSFLVNALLKAAFDIWVGNKMNRQRAAGRDPSFECDNM